MARRSVGEFRPPREVVSLAIARVTGPGVIEVTEAGLRIDGRVSSVSRVPRGVLVAAGVGLLVLGAVVPGGERPASAALLALVAWGVWITFRSEYGWRGVHAVAWAQVEHVARLPADPDVVAIVLSAPIAGAGSPEQVYFAPSNGVEWLAEALRALGPPGLSMDLDSALQARDRRGRHRLTGMARRLPATSIDTPVADR